MILIISGMSCAGKDTAQDYLASKGWDFLVSTTSRPIRPNEIEGKNYYFVSRPEFEDKIKNDELLEYRSYKTKVKGIDDLWYYGVEKKNVTIEKNTIAVLDSVGYHAFVKEFGKENVKLLWIDLPDELRRERNIARLDYDETEFNRRTIQDAISFGDLRDHATITIDNSGTYEDLYYLLDILHDQLLGINLEKYA